MNLRMKLTIVLLTLVIVLIMNSNFIIIAEENDEYISDDVYALDGICEFRIWEIILEEVAKSTYVGWNEISDSLDTFKYETCIYNLNCDIVDSTVEAHYPNKLKNQYIFYSSEKWNYEYRFLDISEAGICSRAFRLSNNIASTYRKIARIYFNKTQSEQNKSFIQITQSIKTQERTYDITPHINWEGVFEV